MVPKERWWAVRRSPIEGDPSCRIDWHRTQRGTGRFHQTPLPTKGQGAPRGTEADTWVDKGAETWVGTRVGFGVGDGVGTRVGLKVGERVGVGVGLGVGCLGTPDGTFIRGDGNSKRTIRSNIR